MSNAHVKHFKELSEELKKEIYTINEENDAQIALLKTQVSEAVMTTTEIPYESKIWRLQYEIEEINIEVEPTFKSYVKSSDTLTEMQTHLCESSKIEGLGHSSNINDTNILKKNDNGKKIFLRPMQGGTTESYNIGQKDKIIATNDKGMTLFLKDFLEIETKAN